MLACKRHSFVMTVLTSVVTEEAVTLPCEEEEQRGLPGGARRVAGVHTQPAQGWRPTPHLHAPLAASTCLPVLDPSGVAACPSCPEPPGTVAVVE